MGWSVGYDSNWRRWIGYGVPTYCDHPDCNETIDRGLAFVCGGEPYGGDHGCGLFFCDKHLTYHPKHGVQCCEPCADRRHKAFKPKPEHPDWIHHLQTDESWKEWREKNPDELARMLKESNCLMTIQENQHACFRSSA